VGVFVKNDEVPRSSGRHHSCTLFQTVPRAEEESTRSAPLNEHPAKLPSRRITAGMALSMQTNTNGLGPGPAAAQRFSHQPGAYGGEQPRHLVELL